MLEGVLAFGLPLGGFWMVFRSTLGCSEVCFTLFGVAFLEFFDRANVSVALCTFHTHLRHFLSQLTVSTTCKETVAGNFVGIAIKLFRDSWKSRNIAGFLKNKIK